MARARSAAAASSLKSENAATAAAARSSANTSPPSALATPNPCGRTSPVPAKSPAGSCSPATLTDQQEARLLQVRLACPDITRACDLARAFTDLVRNRRGSFLLDWIRQAEQDAPKPMSGFAGFLRQDLAAVTAGPTLEWSSGVVEGHVNKVKTLKRAMYGRASFRLLRIRILTHP
ncbi:transposase [Streptomyces flavidovirens]|uniref:transposase n=1 Tax=Streptomyces flavidovirens TaxID=67298 RepID=UPI00342140BC